MGDAVGKDIQSSGQQLALTLQLPGRSTIIQAGFHPTQRTQRRKKYATNATDAADATAKKR